MPKYKIAWLPGDGIGKDVMDAAKIVLDELKLDAEYIHGDIGWEFWMKEGNAFPDRTRDLLQKTDCALFGAITSKPKEEAQKELAVELQGKGYSYFSPIVQLRQQFNLHTNLRPCKSYKGNPLNYKDDIDIVMFRENTEGMYAGVEFFPFPQELKDVLVSLHSKMKVFKDVPNNEMAISTRIMTEKGCKSIVRQAYKYAREKNRKMVTVIEKPNVLRETGGLMIRSARAVAQDFPDIKYDEANIDAICMWLVKNPHSYDVLVAENLFGDIVSDLCAQLVGGMGFASSANIGDNYAVFEPTHGSAPKYTGMYKVNPIAMILTCKLMLEHLKEQDLADRIENAVAKVVLDGKVRTYDMGGNNTTLEVAKEIARKLVMTD